MSQLQFITISLKVQVVFIIAFLVSLVLISCEENCETCEDKDNFLCPVDSTREIYMIDLSEVDIIRVFQTRANIAVEIDDEEVDSIEIMGIVWSRIENPELLNNAEGKISTESIVEDFVGEMADLEPGTEYYFRVYAETPDSLFYSLQQSFTTIRPDGTIDSVEDIEGNSYRTKILGGTEWMIDNLKTMHFRDGTAIPTDFSDEEWGDISSPGYGIYDYNKIDGFESDTAILEAYGALYNWYAVADEKGLCPDGWHVPTDNEWREFEMYLGMSESASLDTDYRGDDEGAKIKIRATHPSPQPRWDAGNESNNSTGFSVIPGGARFENGNYGYKGFFGYIWTSTEVAIDDAWGRTLVFSETSIGRDIIDKNMGMNIRCVRDDH